MKALLQRVARAEVRVGGDCVARIERGLLVYVGVAPTDAPADARKLADKVVGLRIFPDEQGKLNRSVRDVRGGVLAVPNFTLQADTRKGRRPAFSAAAAPDQARALYETFVEALRTAPIDVASGVFGATMAIRSDADGPVNCLVEVPPAPPGTAPMR
ncbi:MAG: D-tyrosyl-tRNA(Tyr) deacylase [Phycisphaerae bacterium]|nr:D-tyrosyl-tRNA(Tyr) deacylase [Phycisphaerae bacterium]